MNVEEESLDLSILTDRQATAYNLRKRGFTFPQIACSMDITSGAARKLFVNAERRIREFDEFKKRNLRDSELVDFPLKIGELKIIIEGLEGLSIRLRMWGNVNSKDWMGYKLHQYMVLDELLSRAQDALEVHK